MHDIRAIRENPEGFDASLARRGISGLSSEILAIDASRRAKIGAAETAQAEQNKASKSVGAAKAKGDDAEFERLRALVSEKKAEIAKLNDEAKAEDARLYDLLIGVPNLPFEDTPVCTVGAHPQSTVLLQWSTTNCLRCNPAWISKQRPSFRVRGLYCCRAGLPACTAPWRSSCSTLTRRKMA